MNEKDNDEYAFTAACFLRIDDIRDNPAAHGVQVSVAAARLGELLFGARGALIARIEVVALLNGSGPARQVFLLSLLLLLGGLFLRLLLDFHGLFLRRLLAIARGGRIVGRAGTGEGSLLSRFFLWLRLGFGLGRLLGLRLRLLHEFDGNGGRLLAGGRVRGEEEEGSDHQNVKKERQREVARMLNWGFNSFGRFKLFAADETVAYARVWGGEQFYVPLIGKGVVDVVLPRVPKDPKLSAEVIYDGPLKPPVKRGDQVATLRVTSETNAVNEIPLYAAEDV